MLQGKIRENLTFTELSKKKIEENHEFDAKKVFQS